MLWNFFLCPQRLTKISQSVCPFKVLSCCSLLFARKVRWWLKKSIFGWLIKGWLLAPPTNIKLRETLKLIIVYRPWRNKKKFYNPDTRPVSNFPKFSFNSSIFSTSDFKSGNEPLSFISASIRFKPVSSWPSFGSSDVITSVWSDFLKFSLLGSIWSILDKCYKTFYGRNLQ